MIRAAPVAAVLAVGLLAAGVPALGGPGSPAVSYEINLTTVAVIIVGGITWWITVTRLVDRVKETARKQIDMEEALKKRVSNEVHEQLHGVVNQLGLKLAALEVQHDSLKDEVYKEYLSTEAWRAINREMREDAHATKAEIMAAIGDLSKRMDTFIAKPGTR